MFVLCSLTAGMLGWSLKEEKLSFSETLSNGTVSVTDFVMLSPLFLCAPTADRGCHVTCSWSSFFIFCVEVSPGLLQYE